MPTLFAMVASLIIAAAAIFGSVIYDAWRVRRAKVRAEEEARDAEFDRVSREVHKASPIIKDIEGE